MFDTFLDSENYSQKILWLILGSVIFWKSLVIFKTRVFFGTYFMWLNVYEHQKKNRMLPIVLFLFPFFLVVIHTQPHTKLQTMRLRNWKKSSQHLEVRWWGKSAQKKLEFRYFFGFANFLEQLPKMLDPKCYTWLESYNLHCKIQTFFWSTSEGTEFC